jgi:hypothetical protein
MLVTVSQLPSQNEHQWSVNSFGRVLVSYIARNCTALSLNRVINSWCFQYVSVLYFTNMHAMYLRSDFLLACSSGVNTSEPAFYFTITLRLTVLHIKLPEFQIPTTMSDSKSLNISLQQVMTSSKNEHVFICNLSDRTL